MGRNHRRLPGLFLRGGAWHIDKVIDGKRICESTGTCDIKEAEAVVARLVQEAREVRLLGAQRTRIFREAATKFLEENTHKRSLERDARALKAVDPFIGELPCAGCITRRCNPMCLLASKQISVREPSTAIWRSCDVS